MRILIGLILCLAYVNCKVFPECNGKSSRTYVASHRKNNCRSFIYCDGDNSFEDRCPVGLAFSPVELTCVPRESDDCDSDSEMNNNVSPIKSPSIPSKQLRIVSAVTKQHPTPPGRPLTNSPTRSTLKGNSNRPVPTRKPLGSTTLKPKPTPKPMRTNSPTKLTTLILSTTRRKTPTTSVSPNRPTPGPTNRPSERPKTTVVPTRGQTKNSSPIYIPTAPGSQNFPDRPKEQVSTTLPKEKEPTELSTERTLAVSSTKSTESERTSDFSSTKSIEMTSTVSSTKSHPKTKPPLILTSSTVATKISIEEQCIKKLVGNFADPDDCRYYYRCMRGVLNKQECPKGFGWDAKSKMCTSKGCMK